MIIGVAGEIGSGKSLKQLQFAVEMANRKRRRLVFNFSIDFKQLKRYCAMKRYGWVAYLIDTGQIACVSTLDNVTDILAFENSVVCLDEAGIFLNAREFNKTPKQFLMDLAQSRKDGIDLIWAAQFDDQVDKQFRMLTQFWIHCQGFTKYSPELRAPELVWKCYRTFSAGTYQYWLNNHVARNSFLKTWFRYAQQTEIGPLTRADRQAFRCFSSFARLDKQKTDLQEMMQRSRLPAVDPLELPGDYYQHALAATKRAAALARVPKIVRLLTTPV